MKKLLALLIVLKSLDCLAFEAKEILIQGKKLFYYSINSSTKQKNEVFTFLHGSVAVYKNLSEAKNAPLDSLLELNSSFVKEFTEAGYHLIIPIAFEKYNWLQDEGYTFLEEIYKQEKIQSENIYLAGFSDGATGAYRYFYSHVEKFKGLISFNGFPQLDWFSKSVNYKNITNKKILFLSQEEDKQIPYEFSLIEYRRQKLINHDTYFMLRNGKHEFVKYNTADFSLIIELLQKPSSSKANTAEYTWIYPAIDGLIIDNKLMEVYPFRPAIAKKYSIDIKESMSQKESYLYFKKHLHENIEFLILLEETPVLEHKKFFSLGFSHHNQDETIRETTNILMDNYLILTAWEE